MVRAAIGEPVPRVAVVLGSGLGGLADRFEDTARIATAGIPGWPESTVKGHAGELLAGDLGNGRTLGVSGRVHMYEGHDPRSVGFPIRVLARLGVEILVLSNAAGAIDARLAPGDLMLIADHVDLTGRSPLRGPPAPDEVRHLDSRDAYDPVLRRRLRRAARDVGVGLHEGVYAATLGPSYETPAEI
ncbi:MAG: purine-nucleoside phosphorylase, partial [Gemmatimonadota bacterium]